MKMIAGFKPETCVAKGESAATVMKHVVVQRREGDKGWAFSSDGKVMVRVPVDLLDDDIEGAVPVDSIKFSKGVNEEPGHVELRLSDKVEVFGAHASAVFDRPSNLTPPVFEACFPKGKPAQVIAFRVSNLQKVASAMGSDDVILELRGNGQVIVVKPNGQSECLGIIRTSELEASHAATGQMLIPLPEPTEGA